jgi:Acyl carrier protein phosphodiesterase
MATLLHMDSSAQSANSVTRRLTAQYANSWKEANPGGRVTYRDLTTSGIIFLSNEHLAAFQAPEESLSAAQKELLRFPDELMNELLSADTLVIGAPMYNFTVPAVLKGWIDLIVRPGLTYSFAGGFPQGLLKNKKAVIVTASGSDYSQPQMKSFDYLEPYLRAILGFIGITEVTFVKSHGTNPEVIAISSSLALEAIEREFAVTIK